MKTVTRIFALAFAVLLVTALHTFGASKPDKPKQHTDIHARYFYSAETVYREIVIDGLKLKITTFNDADKKCKNWVAQSPCWTADDLRTREVKLSKRELTGFVNLINKSGFLLLDKTYGGASEGQRYYTETIGVKLGEVQQQVVYQSFPDAKPQPAAFTSVAKWLATLVKKKFNL